MNTNGREFAKKMREGKCVDFYGNVVCSLEMWEKIASIIEEQSNEIDNLLNLMLKIDTQQAEKIKVLEDKLAETYLRAERLKIENDRLSNNIRCKECRFCYHNKHLGTYRCLHFGCVIRPNDYCSWGKLPNSEKIVEVND